MIDPFYSHLQIYLKYYYKNSSKQDLNVTSNTGKISYFFRNCQKEILFLDVCIARWWIGRQSKKEKMTLAGLLLLWMRLWPNRLMLSWQLIKENIIEKHCKSLQVSHNSVCSFWTTERSANWSPKMLKDSIKEKDDWYLSASEVLNWYPQIFICLGPWRRHLKDWVSNYDNMKEATKKMTKTLLQGRSICLNSKGRIPPRRNEIMLRTNEILRHVNFGMFCVFLSLNL